MSFKSGDAVLVKNPLGRAHYQPAKVIGERFFITMPPQYYVQMENGGTNAWYYEEQLELDRFDPFSVRCTQCGKTAAERINKYCGDGTDKDNGHHFIKYEPRELTGTWLEPEIKMMIEMAKAGSKYFTPDYHRVLNSFEELIKQAELDNARNPF